VFAFIVQITPLFKYAIFPLASQVGSFSLAGVFVILITPPAPKDQGHLKAQRS
jgi:hypothetical protein